MKIAIVTGASSGMGEEFCRHLDRKGLDEIWIIARRADRLESLAETLSTHSHIIPGDLTDISIINSISNELDSKQPDIRYLVNCAGFGKFGNTWEIPAEQTKAMIDLNITALVEMSSICIPYMSSGSRMIQLCSASAYIPLYKLNVYASTKAFVRSFCSGLSKELENMGVTVTEVSPGWVDTDFIGISRETDVVPEKVFKHILTKEEVVSKAMSDAEKGKRRSVTGSFYRMQIAISTHFPELAAKIWRGYFGRQ